MYHNVKHRKSKKTLILTIAILCCLISVSGTLAYIHTNANKVENIFTPSKVMCEVDETFENNVKSNVSVKNTGDTDAFIRAAIVATWVDNTTGNTLAITPVLDTDYTITFETSGWTKKSDGYYYCLSSIAPNDNTPILISECKMKDGANIPDNAVLSIEILASAIQSEPASVVADKWGVSLGGSSKNN